MKVCVIKPGMFAAQTGDALPPLLFAILKPLTPPEVELVFLDENIEPIPDDLTCDAAALSIDTFTARRGYLHAARLRARGIPVLLGGIHATLVPDEAAQHADAVILGDAEDTWGAVVADLQSGTLRRRYESANDDAFCRQDLDYSVFAGKRYHPVHVAQFSRGCRFACDFCSIHAQYGRTLRTRPAAAVAETIAGLPRHPIFFADDNLFSDPAQMDELLTALAPLRRRWVCQISIDAARDFDLLCRLKRSGCFMVLIGFETLTAENLRRMNKGANLAADYEAVIGNIRRAGLMLYGTFVIGYDADTADTALALADFARKHGFAIANFNPLIPTPGTELYARLEREGRLLYERWWDDATYCYGDTAFAPAGMSPQELAESCRRARYAFYSLRGILARLRGANCRGLLRLSIFLLANLVSRKSIRTKQGRRLGE